MFRRWERGSRYYLAHLQKDLFNWHVVTRVNGGIGTQMGKITREVYATEQEALNCVAQITKKRKQRGYKLVT